MPRLPSVSIEEFKHGNITRFEGETIPRGAAEDSLNWMTQGDHIELRGGQVLMGTEVADSTSPVTGLKVASRFDGTKVPFYTHDRKLKYYRASDETSQEVSTDLIAAAADGEDMAMDEYHSLAGAFLYVSSPNSSFYKVPVANPGSAVDQLMTNHRGFFRIKRNSCFLWRRKGTNKVTDQTGIYRSYIDKDELSDYTQVTSENVGTGDGSTLTFADTLSQVTGKRTCHYITVTDGVETFNDDRNGGLVGSAGGTGTINYATGAISVTFFAAPANAQAITCDYYYEDATSTGILDFSKSTPRSAGQGFTVRQDDGGSDMQNLGSIDDDEMCFHVSKTWRLTLAADDSDATNTIFRSRVGIEYWRSLAESADGIYYVDSGNREDAYVRILVPSQYADNKELPKSISDLLKLSPYRFDKAVLFEWGQYLALACRTSDSAINNRTLFYNNLYGSWDPTDIRASVFEDYNGTLIAGDSGTPNLYTIFSGFADEDSVIPNYWRSGNDLLGSAGVKTVGRMVMRGLIMPDQSIEVSISLDNKSWVTVYIILGSGSYVDQSSQVLIGSPTVGSAQVGGSEVGVYGNPYDVEFKINTEKCKRLRWRVRALGAGVATVSGVEFKDIRDKGRHSLSTKTV